MAQCIPLQDSTTCPAFNASSISTDSSLTGYYPFLAFVSDVKSFDTQFAQYVSTTYSQQKYAGLLNCSSVNLSNTTNIYARYTQSFLCSSIVQYSIKLCNLSGNSARSLCADDCAAFAISEETIASTPSLCGSPGAGALDLIRADFTTCALPADSLSNNCVKAASNEPNNCGFASNLPSLCSYCAASSPNATDSCCLYSNTETRCQNVKLPFTTSMGTLFPSATAPANSTASGSDQSSKGLSAGAVAGIVVGSILGAVLLLALLIGLFCLRRRENRPNEKLNTPSSSRFRVAGARAGVAAAVPLSYSSPVRSGEPVDLPQGARVHHMAALEGSDANGSEYIGSGSSGFEETPESKRNGLPKRQGSRMDSPEYAMGPSPEGMPSGQSEQWSRFGDYYSNEDIHPGDKVSTLWAYQPRANDEWELERGDMLRVVGIWDDGWATGYKIPDRAEDWETRRSENRDSGLSNISASKLPGSGLSVPEGEIKAFPLVCVCLPPHWRKTIEGDAGMVDPTLHSPTGSP